MAVINPELDAFKKLLTSKKALPRKEKELIDQFSALLREKNTLKERLSLIDRDFVLVLGEEDHREQVATLEEQIRLLQITTDVYKSDFEEERAARAQAHSQKDDLHREFEKREKAMKQQIQKLRNQCDAYSKRGGSPSGGAGEACQQCPYRQQQLQALEGQNQHLERELDRARLELDQLYELRNNQKEVEARAYQLEQELARLKQRKDVLQELSKGVTVTPNVGRGNGQPDTQLLAQLPFPVYKVAHGQQLPRQAQAVTFPRNYRPNYGDSEGPPPLRPENPPHVQSHSEGGAPNSLLRSQQHGGAQYQQPSQCSPGLLPATVREEEFKTAGYLRSAAQENSTRVPLSRSQSAFPLHSQDTDTDLEELYEPYAAGKDPQSRERLLSQDDQVHHSYFQAPGNPPPHSPPPVLRHSDYGSPRVRSSATLPHLPQNGYSDSRASCANDNKLERPLSQDDQAHHGYRGIDSRTRGRTNSSAAALCDRSVPQPLFEAVQGHGYSETAGDESARFSGHGFDTAFRTSTPPIPPRETPPLPQSTNSPIPPRNIPPVPTRQKDPRSRERPLSQDDQVHHSYFPTPGNHPLHSPPSVLRHSDYGSPRVRSSATLPHLPQNGYSDSRASCANDNKLERPLSQDDQAHHGYRGIDSRTRGRTNSSAAALCDRSVPQPLFEAVQGHGYSETAGDESARFSGHRFDTAFRTSTPPIPPRETPPLPQGTNSPIPPRNIPPVPPQRNPATLPRSIPRVPPREHPATLPRNTPSILSSDAPPVPPRAPIGLKPIACSIDPSSQTQGSNSPEIPEQSELPFFPGFSEPGSSSPALSHLAFYIHEDSSASPQASPRSSVHRHDTIYGNFETTQSHDAPSDLSPGGAARADEASGTLSSPVLLDQKDQLPSQFDQQLPHKSFPRFTKRYEIPETLPPIAKSRNLASMKDSKAASPQSGKQTSSIPIPLSRKWQDFSPSCQSVSTVSPKPKPRSKLTRAQSDAALLKRSLPTAGFRTPDYEEPLPTHERKSKENVLEVGLTGEIAEMNEISDSRKQQTNDQTPFDSNLTCPVCGKMFRVFETLKCGSHVRKCQEIHEEKKQWNERVRGCSRGFSPHQSEHEVSDPRQVNSSTDPQCGALKSNDQSFKEDTPRPIPKKRNKT